MNIRNNQKTWAFGLLRIYFLKCYRLNHHVIQSKKFTTLYVAQLNDFEFYKFE